MSQKTILVEGATCQCKFGVAPDTIKVTSHSKEYVNQGKLIATTLEIGATTFQANTFGSCKKQNNNPCKAIVTEWTGFYEEVTLSNGGKILLEDSKATCPIGGSGCITVINHGQIQEPCQQNADNADQDVQSQLNPLVDLEELKASEPDFRGIIICDKEL